MAFDTQAAAEAGHSIDDQINHLAKLHNYDSAAAEAAGFTKEAQLQYLAGLDEPAQAAAPSMLNKVAEYFGMSEEMPDAAIGTALGAVAGPAMGPAIGEAVDFAADKLAGKVALPSATKPTGVPQGVLNWYEQESGNPYAGGKTKDEAYAKGQRAAGQPVPSRGSNIKIRKGNLGINNQLEPQKPTLAQKAAANIVNAEKVNSPSFTRRMLGTGVMGGELGSMKEELEKGNYGRAGLSGLGALGGAASQSKIKPVRAIGTGLSTLVPAIQMMLPESEDVSNINKKNGGQIQKFDKGGALKKLGAGLAQKAAHELGDQKVGKLSDWAQNHIDEFLVPTQADRMGGVGGPSYSANQIAKPEYEGRAWGSGNKPTATMITNLAKDPRFGGVEKQNFTPILGKGNMHQSNQIMFDQMVDQFYKDPSKLPPDLAKIINDYMQSGGMIGGKKSGFDPFPNFDIRDRGQVEDLGKTFRNRALIGQHAFGGEGIGGRKAQIIPYNQILQEGMDPLVADAKTFSLGPRMFKLTGEVEQTPRPDLNAAFPYQLFGTDAGVTVKPTPSELSLMDFQSQWRKDTGKTMPLKSGALPQPGYFEHTLGYKPTGSSDRIYPRQKMTEDWVKELQRSGFANGGKIAKEAIDAFKKKFTPGYFHASPSNKIKEFDPAMPSSAFGTSDDGRGKMANATFLTTDPRFANSFLPSGNAMGYKPGSTVYPVSANLGKHFDYETPEGRALIKQYLEQTMPVPKGEKEMQQWIRDRAATHGELKDGSWPAIENPAFQDFLRANEFDSFAAKEAGRKNVGIFDPKNIRGKFAKFNPEDAESADFMKAAGGSVQHFDKGSAVRSGLESIVKFARHPHGQDPKVAQALEEYLKGNISQEERMRVMNQFLPMRQWKELPPNYSDEQIKNALMANKQGKALAPVPAGMRVGNRLDIPAYTQNGVYVDTTHDLATGNAPISYNRTGHLKDVEFSSKPNQAVRVGLGTKEQALTPMGAEMGSAKSPFALIKGTNVGTSDNEVRRMMQEMIQDPRYTQIGMDPRKHSQFYDKSTGLPVWAAEEKLQSGPLILAPKKGLEITNWNDPRLNLSDFEGKKYAGGGKVGALEMLAKKLIPQAERQTNKSKFLEGNHPMVPEVVYHATRTAPKGDAIDQMIGSKYGTLGSGMYTTPDTQFGSTYTGIPTPETIEKLKTSFPAMARPFVKAMDEGDYSDVPMGGYMMPLHPSVKNPLILEGIHADPAFEALAKLGVPDSKIDSIVEKANEKYGSIGKEIQSRAQKLGHDGVILFKDGNLQEMVTYSPNQLKSAIGNEGTFNPYDPRLSKKRGGKVKK